jgi:hypothetical protein
MKVIYYSCSGNSEKISKYIAEKKNGEVLKLETKKDGKTPGIIMMIKSLRKKNIKLINNFKQEIKDEKTIYVVTPIWAGSLSAPVRTFLNENNFESKKVTLITVQSDPDLKGSEEVLKEMTDIIEKQQGKVKETKKFIGSFYYDKTREVDLNDQLEKEFN